VLTESSKQCGPTASGTAVGKYPIAALSREIQHCQQFELRIMTFSFTRSAIGAALLCAYGCAPSLPNHGFQNTTLLGNADDFVVKESAGGQMDPRNMAQEDQRYAHDNIAYDRNEEGYYQWGMKMYQLGYRDELYIRDLEVRAFKHPLLDSYDKAVQAGFEAAEDQIKK
jgi:hypothetical protein